MSNTHHVVPNSSGGWDVKRGGGVRTIKHFDMQKDAIKYGREVSRKQNSEFYIHRTNGTIRDKDSHGNDPRNIPG